MQSTVLTKIEDVEPVCPAIATDDKPIAGLKPPRIDASGASKQEEESERDWEDSISLYEELLDDTEPFVYPIGEPYSCTPEEANIYRFRLRELGSIEAFVEETLVKNGVTAKKLCTAFGVRLPSWLTNEPDESCLQVLGFAMIRELKRRIKLPEHRTIDDAAKLINSSKNIIVITGAGISTSLGIPDFRSKSTGFYTKLQEMGYDEPEEVFDLGTFDEHPNIFYSLAGEILPDLHRWTPTHQFIRMIQDKGKLQRNYTQNIDNIESHAGIESEKVIQCHGSWATATCRKCAHKVPGEEIFNDVKAKKISYCRKCTAELQVPNAGIKRKRSPNGINKARKRQSGSDSDDDGLYDIPQPGVMKPDITFFGEKLPDRFFDTLQNQDVRAVDLIIVIGTSMKVAPVGSIPEFVSHTVPQIYISRDPIHHLNFDINLLGDCDRVIAELCKRACWDLKHEMIKTDEKVAVKPHETLEDTFTVMRDEAT